ncbi:MAG: VCBS repeat-containing protein [Nitrospirae bacterium]|nr:VCBS repeat-containing protein [Nitrospirota bacterium]
MSGLFHSTDLGVSWDTIDFRQIQSFHYTLVQFTSDPSVLYSIDYSSSNGANAARPSRSTDGGATWTHLSGWSASNRAFNLFADPGSTNRLIVTTVTDLYFSNDGGTSFTSKYTDATGNGLSIGGAFFDGQNIYAGTNAGLLVSNNGGVTFNLSPVTGIPVSEAIFSFAGAKQGATTRFYALTVDVTKVNVSGKTDPLTSEDVYDYYKNVYTLDVGQNWTLKVTGIAAGDQPVLVSMAANDINTAYLAGRIHPVGQALYGASPIIYKTTTGGNSWNSVFNTTNNQNIYTGWTGQGGDMGGGNWWWGDIPLGLAVAPNDSGKAVFTDKGGVPHLTSDGGATWRQIYTNPTVQHIPGASTPARQYYRGVGLEPTESLWITWADSSSLIAGFADIAAIRSKDSGNTWGFDWSGLDFNIAGHDNYSTEVLHISKHPSNGTLYASQSNGYGSIYQAIVLTDARIDNIGGGAIRYSTDKGQNWSTLHVFGNPGYPVIWTAIDPNNTNRMYASVVHYAQGLGGIYVSSDIQNGTSSAWTQLTSPQRTQGHPYNLYVLNDATVVATFSARIDTTGAFTASSGVFISSNGGTTWIDRSDPAMLYYTKNLTIDPNDPTQNTWYVGTSSDWGMGNNNVRGVLYKTTNRGQTWAKIFTADSVESTSVNPSNPDEVYVATTTTGLWYSSNATSASPTFTQVTSYPFRNPNRIFYNPYNQHEIWVSSNGNGLRVGQASTPAPTPVSVTKKDFDGDGKSDILWRNSKTGDVAIWLMNGKAINVADFVVKGLPSDWAIQGIGDFNGDGKADILLQNVNGDLYIWLMDGTRITGGDYAQHGLPREWVFEGIGDFNGDGKADLLWQNTITGDVVVWLMDGTKINGGGLVVEKGLSSDWTVKAVADFNGDGKSDVVLQDTNGDVYLWLMDGVNIQGGGLVAKGIPGNWHIKAVDDFNGDGKADLLWQDTTTGDTAMWLMDGAKIIIGNYVVRGIPSNWNLLTTGDYNGDGKSDVLWQDTTTGDVAVWLMDGLKVSGGDFVVHGMPSDWQAK